MIQIVTDRPNEFNDFISQVCGELEYCNVKQVIVVAVSNDEYPDYSISYMNCSTDDLYSLGSLIQKTALKEEIMSDIEMEELLDDWEDEDEI